MLQKILFLASSFERRFAKIQGKGSGANSIAREVTEASRLLPVEKAVIFDIGANKGLWTREILHRNNRRIASIHAFEPSGHNWADIEAISDRRVTLVKSAVGATSRTATLYSDAPGSGLASLTQRELSHVNLQALPQEQVSVITIDSYIIEKDLDRVDFIKIDIEGHELEALHGAKKSLSERKIAALSFEFGGANIDTRTYLRDFWALFQDTGYDIFRITPFGVQKIERYHERHESFTTTNYIATFRIR